LPEASVDRPVSFLAGEYEEAAKVLEAHELQVLLAGGDPGATQAVPAWRRIA
jgi:hypothetical protein